MHAGDLDRRITFEREGTTSSATSTEAKGSGVWSAISDGTVWAKYQPVSDGEKWRAGLVEAREVARFTVRWSTVTSGVTQKDRIAFDSSAWGIMAIKEMGRREWLEITAERLAA